MLQKVILICAAITFVSNLFVYKEVNSAEELKGLSEEAKEDLIDSNVRKVEFYDSFTESEIQEVRRLYKEALNDVIDDDNQRILVMENESFTLGVTFMHGMGVFVKGIGKEFYLFEFIVKGDEMMQDYPMADRHNIKEDSSPFYKPMFAKTGYVLGKYFGFTLSVLLLITVLIINRYRVN